MPARGTCISGLCSCGTIPDHSKIPTPPHPGLPLVTHVTYPAVGHTLRFICLLAVSPTHVGSTRIGITVCFVHQPGLGACNDGRTQLVFIKYLLNGSMEPRRLSWGQRCTLLHQGWDPNEARGANGRYRQEHGGL